jgi:hypothetical protein
MINEDGWFARKNMVNHAPAEVELLHSTPDKTTKFNIFNLSSPLPQL